MLPEERYQKIINMLERDGSVKVSALMRLFSVSIETIRRDLEYLEKKGHLKRVYGGAVRSKLDAKQPTFTEREKDHMDEKRMIANIAMRYVSEGQTLALDYGTTTLEVAKTLKKNFENLTVITNSMLVVNELFNMPKYKIILTGGILKPDEFSFFGSMTV